jgi:phthiodiolone/phenolphthiodiolone dimycocerosates ketoreductase
LTQLETSIPLDASRHLPLSLFSDRARRLAQSGVVDQVHIWDQLTSWWPRSMWRPEYTPLASVIPDIDSFPDALAMGAVAAATAPGIGVSISTDAVRRGPAELLQTMLTIANLSGDRSPILQLGGGELKQCKPFGWKRSQGLGRLEDHFRFNLAFWASEDPVVTFEGNYWNFDRAWIGGAKPVRPRVWGLGGGPKLLEVTTAYADGLVTPAPSVWATPEQAAEEISGLKQMLESQGRDPAEFDFGIWTVLLLHDDGADETVEAAFDNKLMRWLTAFSGRIIQSDWRREGLEPPMPDDWHYAMKLLPTLWTEQDVLNVVDKMPRAILERSYITGTPAKVAAELVSYLEAGVTWVMVLDFLPFMLPPDEMDAALDRSIEVCRLLKQSRAADASPVAATNR